MDIQLTESTRSTAISPIKTSASTPREVSMKKLKKVDDLEPLIEEGQN